MAQVDIPVALGAAFWDKQKAALAKAPKAPPTRLAEELKSLTKLHTGVDWDATDFSADSVKSLLAQLQTVVAALDKFETEAKKDKAFPKEPLVAVAAIDKAAKAYRNDVDTYVSTRKAAAAKAAAAAAAQKPKPAAIPGGAGAGAAAKAFKLVRSKLLGAIALLRKPAPPGQARRPMRFVVVQGKTIATMLLAPAVGPSQVKLLQAMSVGEAPFKVFRDPEAQVVWEKNALTFVSDRLSGSVLKKVQLWLKKTFKLNVKLRLRNSQGVVEETEGEDLSDDMLELGADDALSAEDASEEYQERLEALAEAIRKAMAQPMGAKIKALMASSAQSAKTGKYGAALGDLDDIEALLEEGGLGAPIEDGGEESEAEEPVESSAAPKVADTKKELEALMADWKARRADAVTSLKDVAGKIAAARHASSGKAILEIQAVMKNLPAEPATLQQVSETRRWLSTDDVVNDVCELAADVRTPLLVPLERMYALLKAA